MPRRPRGPARFAPLGHAAESRRADEVWWSTPLLLVNHDVESGVTIASFLGGLTNRFVSTYTSHDLLSTHT